MTYALERNRRLAIVGRAAGEARLIRAWELLESEGLRPILIKGWSTARLYPDPSARAIGDIDLCFTSLDLSKALEIRKKWPRDLLLTDFHDGVPDLPDRKWSEIFARTQIVTAQGASIRVLSPEDHLRLTCRHMARHGVPDSRMLQDVAVMLNVISDEFDWDECLRGDPCNTRWVLAAIGLAQQVLSVEIRDPQIRERAVFPPWLSEAVNAIWAAGRSQKPFGYYLTHPHEGWRAFRYRWLNPIRAAFHTRTLPSTRVGVAITVARFFISYRAPQLFTDPARRWILNRGRHYRPQVHQDW